MALQFVIFKLFVTQQLYNQFKTVGETIEDIRQLSLWSSKKL